MSFIPEGGCLGYPGMNVVKRRHAYTQYYHSYNVYQYVVFYY